MVEDRVWDGEDGDGVEAEVWLRVVLGVARSSAVASLGCCC